MPILVVQVSVRVVVGVLVVTATGAARLSSREPER